MKFNYLLALGAIGLLTTTGCKKDDEIAAAPTSPIIEEPTTFGSLNLSLTHSFNDADFALATFYYNGSNEPMSFNAVKYYVSNIELVATSGVVRSIQNSAHLVNLAAVGSNSFTLENVPTGNYSSIRLSIGMDHTSMLPTEIATLQEANPDMFWNDDDGFVFVKLRAYSPDASNGTVDLNLGGCTAPNIAMTQVNTSFTGTLEITEDMVSSLTLNSNLANVFDGNATTLSVNETSDVVAPSELGVNLSRNFADGFSFSSFD